MSAPTTAREYLDWLERDKEFTDEEEALVLADWTPEHVPTLENGWAIPGLDCSCDAEYRCPNHDDRAELAYWEAQFVPIRDAWTTAEDIKQQRHEFDEKRRRREL